MNIQIFPIIALNPLDKSFEDNGTAFLVDDRGHFYTAGHNFYKKERGKDSEKLECFALIDGALFPVEEIFIEYDRDSEGIKKDFVYGEIKNFKNSPSVKTIDSTNPVALGYKTQELDFEQIETTEWNEKKFHLYKVPITIGTNTMTIKNIPFSFDNVLYYTTESEVALNGLSGGPILFNDEILGVLVSNHFITKAYIDKQLAKIKH